MENKKLKMYSLDEMIDTFVGERGTEKREVFEYELSIAIVGDTIRKTRLEQNLTQEDLATLMGANKNLISKLEKNANSVSIDILVRAFKALKSEVHFSIKFNNKTLQLA